MLRWADADTADSAALIAAELLTNAVQHAQPPISVCVDASGTAVRVEVHDGDPRPPVRPARSMSNMTGRGLTLVEALSQRWGAERLDDGGKAVWAELSIRPDSGHDAVAAPPSGDLPIDEVLAAWSEAAPAANERYTVFLGDVPTNLLIEAKAHIDNLVREFTLAAASDSSEHAVPPHLAQLIETVVHGFAEARDAIKRQALGAAQRGEVRTSLRLHLPPSAADAGEAYLAALDEADAYSRAARLLTLETPPAHRLFRRWYVRAVIRQLREVAVGEPPTPVTPFEHQLLEEVQRLAAAQRVTDRAARLQRVTAALARSRTPEDVAHVVVSEGVNALDASGGGLMVPAPDGEHLSVPGVVGYAEELVGALREERRDAPLPAATALREARPIWLESREERDAEFPALRGFEGATVSMCAVPLIVGDRTLGALRFSFQSRRLFDEDERAFVLALAALTAQTLQRTERYAAERQASLELQRALLPVETPDIPGWDIAAFYQPAGGQEAGGDFYDVLPIGPNQFIAVLGDVMGRGVDAAAAMGQLRTMLRAYAIDDADPSNVFERVDNFFAALELGQLATVLYLLIDRRTGKIRIGNAGHLPPLVVDPDGTRELPTAVGTPFGVGDVERSCTEVELPAGAALVMLTDGLVERRGEDIDAGIARVIQQLPGGDVPSAANLLVRVTNSQPADLLQDDDVTVLVVHRH